MGYLIGDYHTEVIVARDGLEVHHVLDTLGVPNKQGSTYLFHHSLMEKPAMLPFQAGYHEEIGHNGFRNEDMIDVLIHRLTIQNTECPSEQMSQAIQKLQEVKDSLINRTLDRQIRGVEGTLQE